MSAAATWWHRKKQIINNTLLPTVDWLRKLEKSWTCSMQNSTEINSSLNQSVDFLCTQHSLPIPVANYNYSNQTLPSDRYSTRETSELKTKCPKRNRDEWASRETVIYAYEVAFAYDLLLFSLYLTGKVKQENDFGRTRSRVWKLARRRKRRLEEK